MSAHIQSSQYVQFLKEIKERVRNAQHRALLSVNRELIQLYWGIGKSLVEKQEHLGWGEGIVEKLALDLQKEFINVKGFSKENLWRMKKFYETYRNSIKLSPLVTELSWSHNLIILFKTRSPEEKEFYIKTSFSEHWSRRELERQIESSLFERCMLSRKPGRMIPKSKNKQSREHFKNEYFLDFLGLKDEFSEKDLRKSIVANLKQFFLEFGKYFTFVGEEYAVNVGGEDFKIDLLFYHRALCCLVAVELKAGDFKPEYIGKMQFYLAALDRKNKLGHESPSVGLILCKSHNKEVVEVALSRAVSPMQVSLYKTGIINRKLLKHKLHTLPFPSAL